MTEIDIDNWKRKDHFRFFNSFDEPFYGISTKIPCTGAYHFCKEKSWSFYKYYLHAALKVINGIEEFRTRIVNDKVFIFDTIHVSPTVLREDKTFGFSFVEFNEDFESFAKAAEIEFERVRGESGLDPLVSGIDVIHCSALPWVDVTSISHARNYKYKDSCPKVSFGKLVWEKEECWMSVSLHAHHGLADGYHAGLFFEKFQEIMNK